MEKKVRLERELQEVTRELRKIIYEL
jgi:hypothetical protein